MIIRFFSRFFLKEEELIGNNVYRGEYHVCNSETAIDWFNYKCIIRIALRSMKNLNQRN
jgi:hypothetical protein